MAAAVRSAIPPPTAPTDSSAAPITTNAWTKPLKALVAPTAWPVEETRAHHPTGPSFRM